MTIDGCTFKDFKGDIASVTNYEALQLEVCHEKHFSSYEPNDDTVCKNVTVKNCTFKNLQRGCGTHVGISGLYSEKMNITGNVFEDIYGYAVTATNYINSSVSGNTITGCGSGIIFRTMDPSHKTYFYGSHPKNNMSSSVSNNTVTIENTGYHNVPYGIQLFGEKISSAMQGLKASDYTLSGMTVKGNKVNLNTTGYGIWLQGTNSSKVRKNTIKVNCKTKASKGGNGDAIRIQGSKSVKILSNTIKNTKTAKADQMIGITVMDASDGATINSNKITKAAKYGICIRTSKSVKIQKNTVKKAGIYGIMISDKSVVTKYKKNKITGSGTKALQVNNGAKIKK